MTPFALPPELTIHGVDDLRQRLLAWSVTVRDLDEAWCVDASAVAEADSAGVQLLLSLERSASACGQSLRLTSASPALTAVAEALGLTAGPFGARPTESIA